MPVLWDERLPSETLYAGRSLQKDLSRPENKSATERRREENTDRAEKQLRPGVPAIDLRQQSGIPSGNGPDFHSKHTTGTEGDGRLTCPKRLVQAFAPGAPDQAFVQPYGNGFSPQNCL